MGLPFREEEFEDIYYGYKDLVWSLIIAAGVPSPDSDDVFQETWRSVRSSLNSFRGEASVQAWIGTIARRRCADYWAARRRRDFRLLPPGEADPEGRLFVEYRTAFDRLASREAVDLIREALEDLEEDQRFVLKRRIDGLKYREIAELRGGGVDTNRVGKRLLEARRALAAILGEKGLL